MDLRTPLWAHIYIGLWREVEERQKLKEDIVRGAPFVFLQSLEWVYFVVKIGKQWVKHIFWLLWVLSWFITESNPLHRLSSDVNEAVDVKWSKAEAEGELVT